MREAVILATRSKWFQSFSSAFDNVSSFEALDGGLVSTPPVTMEPGLTMSWNAHEKKSRRGYWRSEAKHQTKVSSAFIRTGRYTGHGVVLVP